MRNSSLPERFLLAWAALLAVGGVAGLVYAPLAFAGPLVAGIVFVRFRSGSEKKSLPSEALQAAIAVSVMILPIAAVSWFFATVAGEPGESDNIGSALLDFAQENARVRLLVTTVVSSVLLSAVGGAISVTMHNRQLEREYWIDDD